MTGVRVPSADVVATLVAVAETFVDVAEVLGGPPTRGRRATARRTGPDPPNRDHVAGRCGSPRVGWIEQDDHRVALGAGVPLGVLEARTGRVLAAIEPHW